MRQIKQVAVKGATELPNPFSSKLLFDFANSLTKQQIRLEHKFQLALDENINELYA